MPVACKSKISRESYIYLYIPASHGKHHMDTYHHFSAVAKTFSIVISSNNLELEVGSAHVPKHDGRLDDTSVGLNDKTVLALWGGWDDEAVCHGTVIPSVLIGGL